MTNDVELTPYVEDLTWALEDDVDSKQIEAELKNYVTNFDLPIDEAKRCVLKKFGGDPKQLGKVIDKTISELTPTENSVNLLCKIIYIADKEVTIDGKVKSISYGIFGDSTGTVPFTAWHELRYEKSEVIRIYNAYTRSWRDKLQVHLGDRTHVRTVPPDTMPNLNGSFEISECKVIEIRPGLKNITTQLRILDIIEQEINIDGKKRQIFRGLAADETGKLKFAAWEDFNLTNNDVIQVTGGYIKTWRGVPELQLNNGTKIEKLDDEILPSYEILNLDRLLTIRNLKELGGASSVSIEGVVLDIRSTSGLIKRCPECNRVLQNESCMVHGKVEGVLDLRVKGVLDDGTGAVTIVLSRDITERILGMDINGCITQAKEHMRYDIIYEDLIKKLLARPLRVTGSVLADEFGLMMIGSKIEIITPKIKTEAVGLLNGLGVEINNEVWENEGKSEK